MSIISQLLERDLDNFWTAKIKAFKGKSFAANGNTEVFGEMQEINGFKFLNLKIVAPLNVHTFKGCKIVFKTSSGELQRESDSVEIHTDYSKQLSMGITTFDMDLDEELEEMIRNKTIQQIQVTIDKHVVNCSITDTDVLVDILNHPVDNSDSEMPSGNSGSVL